ncbi:MAG TPA: hypothetical protein DCP07_06040 [Lachnospiraceae bacterium]|nr:hypothetical protein [Lachnospiraceae bacterium]
MAKENETQANSNHKDRLFNFIFGREENKEWTLSLYNAINGSNYSDSSLIEFNTLENVLYLDMKNDTSFILSDTMSLYEHQSSYNPNMPLRMLEYVGKTYSGYVKKNKLNKYGERLIMLPVPKLVVFYNGTREMQDVTILNLSDSFNREHKQDSDIEIRVKMLNVNFGHNEELLAACKPLFEYSWFIQEIRNNQKYFTLIQSINIAIEAMPDDYGIKGFLIKHKAEVESMLDTEYNEAEVKELFKEEGRAEGRLEEMNDSITSMLQRGKTVEQIVEFCGYSYEQVKEVENQILNKKR